jgi:hypothetical protein
MEKTHKIYNGNETYEAPYLDVMELWLIEDAIRFTLSRKESHSGGLKPEYDRISSKIWSSVSHDCGKPIGE